MIVSDTYQSISPTGSLLDRLFGYTVNALSFISGKID